jgi:hypothetical protein
MRIMGSHEIYVDERRRLECVIVSFNYVDLALGPSLSVEETKPKAEAGGFALTSNGHRAGWAVR